MIKNNIGIICAMSVELEAIRQMMDSYETKLIGTRTFYEGTINNQNIVLVQCGIGKVNAGVTTALLCENYQPSLIINCGVAGGYSEVLKPLDVVIADRVFYYDVDVTFGDYSFRYGQIQGEELYFECSDLLKNILENKEIDVRCHIGSIMTSDKFASDRDYLTYHIEKYFNDTKVFAVDMESAAVGQVACQYKTPFIIIRSISDVVGINQEHTYTNFLDRACYNASCIVSLLLENIK